MPETPAAGEEETGGVDRLTVFWLVYAAFLAGLVLGEMLVKARHRKRLIELVGEL